MGNRLRLCRIFQVEERVSVLVTALVRHVGDVDSLCSQDRCDLSDHVRNVCVEQGDTSRNLTDSHVACRIVHGILDISVL